MIAWSIDAALESKCFDRILVSTDDAEIAEIARSAGAEVPFVRPQSLSDDFTPTVPVIQHAVSWLSSNGPAPELACCIYATAPFLRLEHLLAGLLAMESADADYALSVARFDYPIQRALRLDGSGRIEMMNPQHLNTRSQDLEPAFHDAGQFYWGRTSAWLSGRPILGPGSIAIKIPVSLVQDIDTQEDWDRAEAIYRSRSFRQGPP